MEYYKLLNFSREPFSNSPDPEMFFRSSKHAECLQKLEISIRLRRGLCVVSGEVGTGKTTICRHLIRSMSGDNSVEIYMILDPSYESALGMLAAINSMLSSTEKASSCDTSQQHKEMIKDALFRKGVQEEKTVVLVVDEGQKLTSSGAEILRELLNYETNDQKLLQIIIFAQKEIDALLQSMPNFADRVGLFHRLLPLNRRDTEQFISHRLERSGAHDHNREKVYFTSRAVSLVYRMSGGYPRKIINLCHNIMLTLIIRGSSRVTPAVVRQSSRNLQSLRTPQALGRLSWAAVATAVFVLVWIFTPVLPGPANMASMFVPRDEPQQQEVARLKNNDAVIFAQDDPDSGKGQRIQVLSVDKAENKTADLSTDEINDVKPDDNSAASMENVVSLPESLGHVRVNKDESLWKIAQRIYGQGSQSLLREIINHNPDISNPDIIHRGQRIRLPALEARPGSENPGYWIAVGRYAQLETACQNAFNSSENLRVLAVWSSEAGLDFWLVFPQMFSSRQKAGQVLEGMDLEFTDPAEIITVDQGSYFFGAG